MHKSIPVVLTALGVAAPTMAAPAAALAATSYKGAATSYQYGMMQITISVKGKKLSTLAIRYAPDSPRSAQLDQYSLPILRSEALRADSYKIHGVSGATFTSQAFVNSLYSAMHKAHLA